MSSVLRRSRKSRTGITTGLRRLKATASGPPVIHIVSRQYDGRRGWLYRGKLCALLQGEPFPLRDERGSGLSPGDTQHYVAALEMSLKNWLVTEIVPGIERYPLKKLTVEPHNATFG